MSIEYDQGASTRNQRMQWWREARFGMFIHWGVYALLGRGEWVMNRECIPVEEYEKLAYDWHPEPRVPRIWAKLAREAGMKYMVMTTKHHDGFCLWDASATDYNAVKRGPGRDLVREYVEACREFGLKIGFYYSLADWRHPDGFRCVEDEAARKRFIEFTRTNVRELCTRYGPIDILWYDGPWPLAGPEEWGSVEMNAMVRRLQPNIIINNRSRLPEDFGTPEGHVTPEAGRDWEACLCLNGGPWGYMPTAPDWFSPRQVLKMLHTCASSGGNLLLNLGPAPDGTLQPQAFDILRAVGRWLRINGEAVYGPVERIQGRLEWLVTGNWTLKGNTAYFWCMRWPGTSLAIGGLRTPVRRVTRLDTGDELTFRQTPYRLEVEGLPIQCPDPETGILVLRIEFAESPLQRIGSGSVRLNS